MLHFCDHLYTFIKVVIRNSNDLQKLVHLCYLYQLAPHGRFALFCMQMQFINLFFDCNRCFEIRIMAQSEKVRKSDIQIWERMHD